MRMRVPSITAPLDEDYGFVTVEALMAARPVITTDDAGGVLEFIENENDGWVTPAAPEALASALARAFEDATYCRTLGEHGREHVQEIRWETVVERLTA